MAWETAAFDSPTGARLAVRHQPCTASAKAVLLISHGLAEHSGRYRRFATRMAAEGLHVYAPDHRGHGETTAPDAPAGRFARRDGAAMVVEDLRAVRGLAAAAHPGLPVVLFGHSMGGLIALNAAETHPDLYQALAVWNSNTRPGLAGRAAQLILLAEQMLKGSDVPSDLLPRLTFRVWGAAIPDHSTPFDWLSHDRAEVDAYIADPLCGFDASVSLWRDVFVLAFAGARSDRLARLGRGLPVSLVGGGEDPSTEMGAALLWLGERMKAAGMKHVDVKIHPTMRHETLNEIGREAAIADFARWCHESVAMQ